MKTMALPMVKRNRKAFAREVRHGLAGFFEYTCRNTTCVLSRFDRFSMAGGADARCPVCGESAFAADEDTGAPN
jgi:hypothetical protein